MRRTILVVDDEEDMREVARLSLETLGEWTVEVASSGQEALEVARRTRPAAILLDVMMPEMDGPATLAALRADPETRAIPVVLLTGKAGTSAAADLARLDVAGMIAKPFDPLALAGEVEAVLGGRA